MLIPWCPSFHRASLQQCMKSIVTMLLTRLQTGKTDNYTYSFVYFALYIMAIDAPGLGPDFLIGSVEQVQPQWVTFSDMDFYLNCRLSSLRLWAQVLKGVILQDVHKLLPKDRKVGIVGLTRLLTESSTMLTEPSVSVWYVKFYSRPHPKLELTISSGQTH